MSAGMRVAISANARVRSKKRVDLPLSSLAEINPYLRVYCEDFLTEPETAVASMLSVLDCNSREVVIRIRKNKKQSSTRLDNQNLYYRVLFDVLQRSDCAGRPMRRLDARA